MKKALSFGVAAWAFATASALSIENVQIAQDPNTHGVMVGYDLTGAEGEQEGIVTVTFLTNDVPCETTRNVGGDVNRFVSVGTGKKIAWQANLDLGDMNRTQYALSAKISAWTKDAPPAYYVYDFTTGRKAFYDFEGQLPGGIDSDVYRTTKIVFRRIDAAGKSFKMGASAAEAGLSVSGIETQHTVSLTKDFYIGVFEVTQAQWLQVVGSNYKYNYTQSYTNPEGTLPQQSVGRLYPLIGEGDSYANVWEPWQLVAGRGQNASDVSFMGKFRLKVGQQVATKSYYLPTEAQWEFACRAGTTTAFSDGRDYDASTDYSDIAVYGTTQPVRVGSKKPNAWGLYDMHGNVGEMCLDNVATKGKNTDADAYYGTDATDPHGMEGHVVNAVCTRGGNWSVSSSDCRSAYRNCGDSWSSLGNNKNGFRIVCAADMLLK